MRLHGAWLRLDSSARKAFASLLALIVWIQIADRFLLRGFDRAFATAVALSLIAVTFREAKTLIKRQQSAEVAASHRFAHLFARAAIGICIFLELLVAATALCVSFR